MSNIRLTQEQQKELKKLYNEALDDLWELWQTSGVKNIYIPFDMEYENKNKWSFFINDEKIQLTYRAAINHSEIYTLAVSKTRFGIQVLDKKKDIKEDLMYNFLKKYEFIRGKMIEQLERSAVRKEEVEELFSHLKRKFEKTSTIEINLGPTNNQHNIEVIEENNKKIGTINFGNQSIKIITEGDITLVNKDDSQKTKKK